MTDDERSRDEVFSVDDGPSLRIDRDWLPDGRYIIYYTAADEIKTVIDMESSSEPTLDG